MYIATDQAYAIFVMDHGDSATYNVFIVMDLGAVSRVMDQGERNYIVVFFILTELNLGMTRR